MLDMWRIVYTSGADPTHFQKPEQRITASADILAPRGTKTSARAVLITKWDQIVQRVFWPVRTFHIFFWLDDMARRDLARVE